MTTTKNKRTAFLETSAVIYALQGDRRMQGAVQEAVVGRRIEVSNFIRMEYLRGVILNLIEFYFLIKESESVSDAVIDWSQTYQPRKLKVVMQAARLWLVDHDDFEAKSKTLRRLGDGIVRLVYDFDDVFTSRSTDPLRCELGRVSIPRVAFREDLLLDFYERFKAVQRRIPNCDLCRFKARQQRSLRNRGIDLYGVSPREKFRSNTGYVQQAERLQAVASSRETTPRCARCELLGDSVIALHAPKKAALVTADKAFVAFGSILGNEVRLLPSLAKLKNSE